MDDIEGARNNMRTTLYYDHNTTLDKEYQNWQNKYENTLILKELSDLLPEIKKEVLKYDDEAKENMPLSEFLCRADQLASFSVGQSTGLSGYSSGLVYKSVTAVNCINCTMFAHLFSQVRLGLRIQPEFIDEFEWKKISESMKVSLLKLVYIELSKEKYRSLISLEEDERLEKVVWDVVNDRLIAIIRKARYYTEIEDGYPINVEGYEERLLTLDNCKTFEEDKRVILLNKREKFGVHLSEEEKLVPFYEEKKKYLEYLEYKEQRMSKLKKQSKPQNVQKLEKKKGLFARLFGK